MSTRQQVTFEDISKALNISKDRYEYIVSYVRQMIKDYRGNATDIIKEVRLNLRGNERYLTMYMTGNSSSSIFLRSTDEQKSDFISSITNTLKFDQESKVSVVQHIVNKNVSIDSNY